MILSGAVTIALPPSLYLDHWLHWRCVNFLASGLWQCFIHQIWATSCPVQSSDCESDLGKHLRRFNICCCCCLQLRETHENEQEKAYQLKAQIIEVSCTFPPFQCFCLVKIVTSSPPLQDGEAGMVHHPDFFRQGHLLVQDASKKSRQLYSRSRIKVLLPCCALSVVFGNWHRYFCQFRKKEIAGKKIRQVKFTPIGHQGQVCCFKFLDV